ncbi:hypothetical protein Q75_09740 [Bacillus coahuilensis p1.1.43]|uniref:DNA methylase adenine-specific domain-containing protein n=1 Tax=Bacillus coahuilensis p1.1.43 TaxID=1150625 RepID=A0A147K7W5_9BACI|nr:hypothetical protein Q75_09740 [Bacillus coahuilensis p1.1.43]
MDVGAREYGDYQTPTDLAERACTVLLNEGINPTTVIEPTFGLGNFITSSINKFESIKQIYGVEIQQHYAYEFKKNILGLSPQLMNRDFSISINNVDLFKHDFPESLLSNADELLFLGNPPWITVAELTKLSSSNIPKKSNIKGLSGLDAVLGKANFDIAEYIIIKLLDLINNTGKGTLAMLCKNQTAKNIVEWAYNSSWNITTMKLFNFDAKKEFNVATDASLFMVRIGEEDKEKTLTCDVYELSNPNERLRTFGWVKDKFVSDVEGYKQASQFDNISTLTWRSGVKHDSSKIFELSIDKEENLINGYKEIVDVEDTLVYNILKSSDLNKESIPNKTRKKVIITQAKTGMDTSYIEKSSPKLWSYLNKYKEQIDNRGSSIYKGKPSFTIFGIGDYSFAPYKVAIAGMYKKSNFSLVLPIKDKIVMLDDTCNFLSFSKYQDALFTFLILNNEKVQTFLKSITFVDAKRPYTIEVLKRIDISKAAQELTFDEIMQDTSNYDVYIPLTISVEDYQDYKNRLQNEPHTFLNDIVDSNGLQEVLF